jgi:hypothetical protein
MIRENNDLNDYDSVLTVIVIIIKNKDTSNLFHSY